MYASARIEPLPLNSRTDGDNDRLLPNVVGHPLLLDAYEPKPVYFDAELCLLTWLLISLTGAYLLCPRGGKLPPCFLSNSRPFSRLRWAAIPLPPAQAAGLSAYVSVDTWRAGTA